MRLWRALAVDVEDAGEAHIGLGGEAIGVDAADEPRAQEGEGLHKGSFRVPRPRSGPGLWCVGGRAATLPDG